MKGFTLIETIVSISILTVAFLGPVAVATRALSNSSVSTNQLIAYNLAEEGMEFVVNKRDSEIFFNPSGGWTEFWQDMQAGNCQSASGCRIDVVDKSITGCTGNPPPLRKDATTGVYSYDSTDPATIFKRCIFMPDSGSSPAGERQVRVIVTWNEKTGSTRSFTLERVVFDRR